jgi:aquaporin Z
MSDEHTAEETRTGARLRDQLSSRADQLASRAIEPIVRAVRTEIGKAKEEVADRARSARAGLVLVGVGAVFAAVTVGFAIAGRTEWRHVPGYVVAQVVGGLAGAGVVAAVVADGPSGAFAAARESGFASNGFGALSPGGYGLGAVLLIEVVLTAVFVGVILSVTAKKEYAALAPVAIGLTLTLIHLVSIPVSNTSVNPARSVAAAVVAGPDALGQVWAFIAAPLMGALLAGVAHRLLRRPARQG